METSTTNSKILTMSFAAVGGLAGLTVHFLLKTFGAAFGVVARFADSDLVRHGAPVLVGLLIFLVLQFNSRVHAWGEEVVTEIRKVVWPSRKDVVAMTIVVIVMVMISSAIITCFDFFAGYLVRMIAG